MPYYSPVYQQMPNAPGGFVTPQTQAYMRNPFWSAAPAYGTPYARPQAGGFAPGEHPPAPTPLPMPQPRPPAGPPAPPDQYLAQLMGQSGQAPGQGGYPGGYGTPTAYGQGAPLGQRGAAGPMPWQNVAMQPPALAQHTYFGQPVGGRGMPPGQGGGYLGQTQPVNNPAWQARVGPPPQSPPSQAQFGNSLIRRYPGGGYVM